MNSSGRPPVLRIHTDELIVDNFAGGGGASLGIEWALGRSPDIAVNHDPEAIALHEANHPNTRHFCESVWSVDPREVTAGKPVGLAWFSPDCKHFSKAKGGKPVSRKIRGLAWVVVRWARAVQPRIIILENVEEFQTWGPLDPKTHKPIKERRGETFRRWVGKLEAAGYDVEWRELRARDYGAPTLRKRLFVVARRDGQPIVWPEPTHGPGRPQPWPIVADCIDWSIPCISIFGRKKPLADNTLKRIARGIQRFVIDAPEPFIVSKDGSPVLAPTLIQTGYGERRGQAPRCLDINQPLGTVVAGGVKHAVAAAFLAKHNGGNEATGSRLAEPVHTITSKDSHALVASAMMKLRGGLDTHRNTSQDWRDQMPTLTAGGTHVAQVCAFLVKYYGTGDGAALSEPIHTITTADRFALVMVNGEPHAIVDIGMRMLVPRELYRGQGFPDTYLIAIPFKGKVLSKTAQVRMCGNSVSPYVAAALAHANMHQDAKGALPWAIPYNIRPNRQMSIFDVMPIGA